MKATEIQIGDLLQCDEIPCGGHRVDYISEFDCEIGANGEIYGLEHLFPIPLTPEILEKNGWEYKKYRTDYMVKYDLSVGGKDCWMYWAIGEHNLDILRQDEKLDFNNLCVQRVVIPCDYVHELQHALRICGLEELADNFKV